MATFQLTNLLTNPSFENTGWAANANCSIAYTTNPVHSGSYSLQVNSTSSSESLVVTSGTIPLVNGHIYYCGVYFYQASAVCSMMQVYWPIAEPTWGNCYVDSTKLGQWQRLGWRVTRSNWSSSNYQFRFDFEGMAANTTAYIDDAVLIDLTACFGSGNEPSLEWCNLNIPYFAGNRNINYDAPIAYDLTMTTPTSLKTGDILNCPYSGGYKAVTLPKGIYKFECWGARGGSTPGSTFGGLGGYVSGILNISTQSTYYLFTGGTGADSPSTSADSSAGVGGAGGYNGGGTGGGSRGPGGGGSSAIGTSSTMSQSTSLLIAGGGGGCVNSSYTASANARLYQTTNVTANHIGGNGVTGYIGCYLYDTCGGGGGYYGGTSIAADDSTHAYGGVNYVGGMFASPSSLAGESVSSRPSANHGYIRITVIKAGIPVYIKTDNTTITQAQKAYIKSNNVWVELLDSQLSTYFTNNKPYRTIMGNTKITPLNYIESTGTQYIDTKYIPNTNTRIVIDFQVTQAPSNWYGIYSSRAGSSGSYANQFALWMNPSSVFRSNYSTDGGIYLDSTISPTSRHIVDHNKNIVTIDNNVVATHAAATFTGVCNLILFAGHTGGAIELPANMRLYSCKIYDNNILVRDFIPALDSFGIACLYDKVNKKCYYNKGTGTFNYG